MIVEMEARLLRLGSSMADIYFLQTLTCELIAAIIYDRYSVDPSTRPICTWCCFSTRIWSRREVISSSPSIDHTYSSGWDLQPLRPLICDPQPRWQIASASASVSFNLSPRRYNPQSIIRIPWNPPNGALKLSASLEFRLDFLKVVSGEFSRKFDHFVACYGRGMLSCHQNHAYDAILSSKPCLRWNKCPFFGLSGP